MDDQEEIPQVTPEEESVPDFGTVEITAAETINDDDMTEEDNSTQADDDAPAGPGEPQQGHPAHIYVGRDDRGDVWQIFDGGTVVEWAVEPGTDSRNVIAGTVNNLGAPSPGTIAQAPTPGTSGPIVTPPPANTGPTIPDGIGAPVSGGTGSGTPGGTVTPPPAQLQQGTTDHGPADSDRHKYVGRDGRGDVWQIFDGTNVIEWAVPAGANSGNVIGPFSNLGPPSVYTVAQATDLPAGPGGSTGPGAPAGPGTTTGPGTTSGPATPPITITGPGLPEGTTTHGPASNPRHKYVGRDGRGDVWQLFDGTNVIEWAVLPGAPSGNILANTTKNLGPPSPMTVAQDDGFRPGNTDQAATDTGGGIGIITILGLLSTLLK